MIGFWIFFILLLTGLGFLIPWWIKTYNRFVYWYVRAQQQWATIAVTMQKRVDNLVPIAEATKQYDMHEHSTLKDVITARMPASEPDFRTENVNLKALLERYPELKADKMHTTLIARTSELEDQLNQSRVAYNYSAQRYNVLINSFPNIIVASFHHFKELKYLSCQSREDYSPERIGEVFENEG